MALIATRRFDDAEGYLERMLGDVTLPRLLIRGAECLLLSRVEFPRPILDVGSGDGTFADALFAEPVDVGVDLQPQAIAYARRFGAYRHLLLAHGHHLPFRDGAFASLLSNSTLEHTADPRAVLMEMHRVARPGAVCAITVPSEYFPQYLLGSTLLRAAALEGPARRYERFMNRVSRHVHIAPPETWRRWLEESGFRIAEWRYYFGARDTRLLDVAHYVSAPSMLTHALLGRWVLFRTKHRYVPLARLLAPYATPGADESRGAYLYFRALKP